MIRTPEYKIRNIQLDGLRGLGTVFVCFFHLFYQFNKIFLNESGAIGWMSYWGTIGVNIFMLITCWYFVDFNKSQNDFSLIKYAVDRIIRLWPCYAIAITITAIVIHIAYLPGRMSTWTDWIINLTFINGFIGTPYVDGAHWYLTTLISLTAVTAVLKKIHVEKNPLPYIGLNLFIILSAIVHIPVIPVLIGGGYAGIIGLTAGVKWFVSKSRNATVFLKIAWG